MAPEITKGYYTPKVDRKVYSNKADIWSIGIVLFEMFCCECPFADDMEILNNEVEFKQAPWKYTTNAAMGLITRMLQKDPMLRCSIDDVLADPWFTNDAETVALARQIMLSSQNEDDDVKHANVPIPNKRKRIECWKCEESFIKEWSFFNHLRTDHGLIATKRRKLSFEM